MASILFRPQSELKCDVTQKPARTQSHRISMFTDRRKSPVVLKPLDKNYDD